MAKTVTQELDELIQLVREFTERANPGYVAEDIGMSVGATSVHRYGEPAEQGAPMVLTRIEFGVDLRNIEQQYLMMRCHVTMSGSGTLSIKQATITQ